jgi:hypothetical protein
LPFMMTTGLTCSRSRSHASDLLDLALLGGFATQMNPKNGSEA